MTVTLRFLRRYLVFLSLLKVKIAGTSIARFSSSQRLRIGKGVVYRLKSFVAAVLVAVFAALTPAAAIAQRRDRRDRQEDRWEREKERREEQKERRAEREARREWREDRRDRREWREERRDAYWDAARYYRRDDRRYYPRRLNRSDWIYRGSDSRYYCRRDDGTTGLIIGGISGAVLGTIIAPGESKVLGTIIGAGAGALIGRAIDDGDVVCR